MHTQPSDASDSSLSDCCMKRQVVAHCEQVIQAGIDATNARRFDMSDAAYASLSPEYRQLSGPPLKLDEILALVRDHIANFPEFKVHGVEMTTEVDLKQNKALVYYQTETTGAPPGVTRPAWSSAGFRKVDGHWLMMWSQTMHGPAHTPGL